MGGMPRSTVETGSSARPTVWDNPAIRPRETPASAAMAKPVMARQVVAQTAVQSSPLSAKPTMADSASRGPGSKKLPYDKLPHSQSATNNKTPVRLPPQPRPLRIKLPIHSHPAITDMSVPARTQSPVDQNQIRISSICSILRAILNSQPLSENSMNRRPHPLALAIFAFSALPAAHAATGYSSELKELVVTAKGYESDTLETASATERLTTGNTAASKTAGDLFRGKPGLAVQGDGGAWGGNPVIRGLKKESVVLLVDGVRLNSAQPQGAIASLAAMSLLDSVEVVKGPGSVLHGTGALGGAINLRTPEAEFSETAEVHGRLSGSTGTVDSSLAGGALVKLSSKDHGLVLGAATKDVDDYETPAGDVDNSGYRSESFLAKYAYRLSTDQKLTLNLQNHEDRDVWYPGSAKTGPAGNGTLIIHSPKQTRTLAELGYEAAIASGTFEASVYRQNVDRQIRAFWDFKDRNQVWNDVSFDTDGAKAQYRMPLGGAHLVTVGLEAWEMTADPARFTYSPPMSDTAVSNSPFRDGEIQSRGVFVQDDIAAGNWNIQFGARYDKVTSDARVGGAARARERPAWKAVPKPFLGQPALSTT